MTKAYTLHRVEVELEAALGLDTWSTKNSKAMGQIQTTFPKVSIHEA
jgi:hypothetical protein